MADHFLNREFGFFDEPQRRFGRVVVGGETALKLDLVPDQFIHEHGCHGGIAGQATQHHGGLPVQTID